jgi:hypothetical protein
VHPLKPVIRCVIQLKRKNLFILNETRIYLCSPVQWHALRRTNLDDMDAAYNMNGNDDKSIQNVSRKTRKEGIWKTQA